MPNTAPAVSTSVVMPSFRTASTVHTRPLVLSLTVSFMRVVVSVLATVMTCPLVVSSWRVHCHGPAARVLWRCVHHDQSALTLALLGTFGGTTTVAGVKPTCARACLAFPH